ncbi:hypothetical protein BU23DRAFT_557596 [Bimuria novae-zelandiae CBS 107.79]|uniref:Uncharacterized protein n=1 Tax=Bimuria novae-zelandiae CBS 107.79 TaxID=1447943 RepID=A0A6A5UYR9_9PLEO|nr:hypothetical protein BU23DRAFT_557596 [Bimuria novae-zelandiae CBS 107.79]
MAPRLVAPAAVQITIPFTSSLHTLFRYQEAARVCLWSRQHYQNNPLIHTGLSGLFTLDFVLPRARHRTEA